MDMDVSDLERLEPPPVPIAGRPLIWRHLDTIPPTGVIWVLSKQWRVRLASVKPGATVKVIYGVPTIQCKPWRWRGGHAYLSAIAWQPVKNIGAGRT